MKGWFKIYMMEEIKVNEYERIQLMHHQEYIMKKNNKARISKWRKAREFLEEVIKTLSPTEEKLKDALELSAKALTVMQVKEMNTPLKRVQLQNMNGEPVWVVSDDHDGRWGIVNSYNETVVFLKSDGVYEEEWFSYNYIFRFKKEIRDYTSLLEKYGLEDE